MRTLFLKTLLVIGIISFTLTTFGQQTYKMGVGLRGGYPSGITGKYFIGGP